MINIDDFNRNEKKNFVWYAYTVTLPWWIWRQSDICLWRYNWWLHVLVLIPTLSWIYIMNIDTTDQAGFFPLLSTTGVDIRRPAPPVCGPSSAWLAKPQTASIPTQQKASKGLLMFWGDLPICWCLVDERSLLSVSFFSHSKHNPFYISRSVSIFFLFRTINEKSQLYCQTVSNRLT